MNVQNVIVKCKLYLKVLMRQKVRISDLQIERTADSVAPDVS